MSFLIYFFVLLVSAASVLFGLDLMTSPLPNTPNVPIGRSVQVAAPTQAQREKRAADERALTPVYPTEPGKPKLQAQTAETSGAAPQSQAQLTPAPAPLQAPSPQMAPAQPKVEPTATAQSSPPATVEAKIEPAVTAQPAAQQTANSCNVQACGAAYQSFRASDCSYQPTSGPRRACTISGSATTVSRAPKSQQTARADTGKDEMREVERIVKRQPLPLAPSARQVSERARGDAGEMSEVERIVRHMTRNESGDIPVQDAEGNVIIVRKTYR